MCLLMPKESFSIYRIFTHDMKWTEISFRLDIFVCSLLNVNDEEIKTVKEKESRNNKEKAA